MAPVSRDPRRRFMHQNDRSSIDRRLGAALDGTRVAELRQALEWLRTRGGATVEAIATASGADPAGLRNFLYRPAHRPDNALLGKLLRYLGRNADLLPDGAGAPAVRALLRRGVQDALRGA